MTGGAASQPRGAFAAVGRACTRRRWWVIGVWAVLFLALGVFAPRLSDQLTPGGFEIEGSTSELARTTILARFSDDFPTTLTAVMVPRDARARPGALDAATERVRAIGLRIRWSAVSPGPFAAAMAGRSFSWRGSVPASTTPSRSPTG